MRTPLASLALVMTLAACGARSPLRGEVLSADVATRDAAEADAQADAWRDGEAGTPGRPCSCAVCSAQCIGAHAGCPDGVPCVRTGGRVVQQCAERCTGPGSLCRAGTMCTATMLCDQAIYVCAEP